MLAELKLNSFRELVKNATREELFWMNGYLSALLLGTNELVSTGVKAATVSSSLNGCTIVYGTETGNSKKVATDLGSKLKKNGILSKIKSLDQYRMTDLSKETCLLIVLSTQGDGEPPTAAKKFYDHIFQTEPALSHLRFGVLALGDSSYPLFCKAGEDVDIRLASLGAERVLPLKKCDTDFETDANEWIHELLATGVSVAEGNKQVENLPKIPMARTGKKVYKGKIMTSVDLNDRGSLKETYHIEIQSGDSIVYEPGDSIGIVPRNQKTAVDKILNLLELDAEQTITYRDNKYQSGVLFAEKLNIHYMPERIIQQYALKVGKEIPSIRMDLADLLRIYPCDKNCNIQQYIDLLEPIIPRLYSISSSPLSHGDNEVHITVSRNNFTIDGHRRFGLCSDYLSGLKEGDELAFYIQKNNAFKLPSREQDIIMIGPGTGIAPFRSFLFERDSMGAPGKNWLFFGEQHFVCDFLYQTELQTFFETGLLTHLNTAFSRDQEEKIYVQHKMKAHGKELYDWIRNGAHIYICGAKDPMCADVEDTLTEIISSESQLSREEAAGFLMKLHEEGFYHKDVY